MRTGRLVLCATTVGALALAGCSQGSTQPTGNDKPAGDGGFTAGNMVQLADAVSSSSESRKSGHFTMKMSLNNAPFITGNGAFDLTKGDPATSMTEKVDLKQIFAQAKKQMQQSGKGTGDLPGMGKVPSSMQLKLVLKDKTLYMKLPTAATSGSGASSGKPWRKMDLGAVTNGQMSKYTKSMEQVDPVKQLEKFKKSGTITKTSSEELDGQHVTHYKIDVDTQKMMQDLPDGKAKQQAQQELGKGMPKTIPLDIWVNNKKLPLQMRTQMGMMGQQIRVTMHYTDWGKPVTISAPPADKVSAGSLPGMSGSSTGTGDGH